MRQLFLYLFISFSFTAIAQERVGAGPIEIKDARVIGQAGTGNQVTYFDPVGNLRRSTVDLSALNTATGVTSFNGRTGTVIPQSGDYASFFATIGHTHTGFVGLTGDQTISGYKTFDWGIKLANSGSWIQFYDGVTEYGRIRAQSSGFIINTNTTKLSLQGATGMEFYAGTGRFRFQGVTTNDHIPVLADNAAAIAAGLLVGEMYRTAIGQLMIRY